MNRPLLFYLSREFDAGDDPDELAKWNNHRESPLFKRAINIVTAIWGVAFVVSGSIQVAFILLLSVEAGFILTTAFPIVVVTGLIFWTQRYLKNKDVFGEIESVPQTA